MLPPEEPEIGDIRGDWHPLAFAGSLPSLTSPVPDFSARLGSREAFAPPGLPSWNSEPAVSAFLGELALRLRSGTIVELGSFVGWTSAHLALALQAMSSGRLHCVESDPQFIAVARRNLTRLGLADRVEFHPGLSLALEVLDGLPRTCDLVFIDTSHRYEDTVREIDQYARRLAPGGCLALHDSIRWGGVRRAVREAADRFHTLTFATDDGNGLTVLRPRWA